MTDFQKSKVYGAEQHLARLLESARVNQVRTIEAYGSTLTLPDEVRFGDLESIQRYVDNVLGLAWVRRTWPVLAAQRVTVRRRKGESKAHYWRLVREIAIPTSTRWAMREIVLLHEIAHHLTPEDCGHGEEFVGTFLLLVREIIGPEVGLLLLAAMHEAGAKIQVVNRVDTIAC